jgi:hypothetical protein
MNDGVEVQASDQARSPALGSILWNEASAEPSFALNSSSLFFWASASFIAHLLYGPTVGLLGFCRLLVRNLIPDSITGHLRTFTGKPEPEKLEPPNPSLALWFLSL